jgi:hypothetical protein
MPCGVATRPHDAGEVAKHIDQSIGLAMFLGKAQHLAAIHKLPQGAWHVACEWLATSSCPVSDAKETYRLSDACSHTRVRAR